MTDLNKVCAVCLKEHEDEVKAAKCCLPEDVETVMDVDEADFAQLVEPLDMRDKFSTADMYHVYSIPKKSGGKRIIEAPSDELKAAQKASLYRLQKIYKGFEAAKQAFDQYAEDVAEALNETDMAPEDKTAHIESAKQRLKAGLTDNEPVLQISHFAHAFARGRSIASGAKPHVGANTVLTVDLKDFFPSVKWAHFDPEYDADAEVTDGLLNGAKKWASRTYASPMSYVFGNKNAGKNSAFMRAYLDHVVPELKMHFCDFGDGKGLRLPQGAPASPFLSNVVMARLDYRAGWRGYPEKVQYTRYADDMIFSGASPEAVRRVYSRVVALLVQLGMKVNPRKYTLKSGYQRKKVLGLVVNALPEDHPRYDDEKDRARTTRYFRRRLRAQKHHCRVLYRLEVLCRQAGVALPGDTRPFLLSKTEGMSFGDKMNKVVEKLQGRGMVITMDDLQSKKLVDPPHWYTRKINGHVAFQNMIDMDWNHTEDSISYCAVKDILGKI